MKLPTVEQLSQHIMEMKNEDFEIIPKAQSAYQYELSAVQKEYVSIVERQSRRYSL